MKCVNRTAHLGYIANLSGPTVVVPPAVKATHRSSPILRASPPEAKNKNYSPPQLSIPHTSSLHSVR
ncbi:hypothetical protein BH09BAC3_BH09BAC3_12490 [soil metagenome]